MNKSYFHYLSRILIIIGFLLCILSPYHVVFGLPIFIVGSILLPFSFNTARRMFLWIILPILLYLPATYSWLTTYDYLTRVPPTDFVLQEDYTGKVTIYYGEPCGESHTTIDKRRQFIIPENGVLILSTPLATGSIDEQYFFANNMEIVRPIPIDNRQISTPPELIQIHQRRTGSGGQISLDEKHSKLEYIFESFYVGMTKEFEARSWVEEEEYESFALEQLGSCRRQFNLTQ